MSEKHLTELPWKTIAFKNKVKDTGLQKALANYSKLDASKDATPVLDALDDIADQAGKLQKAYGKVEEVSDYLDEVTKEAGKAKQAATTLAKSQASKAQAAQAAQAKADAAKKQADDEDSEAEEEQGDAATKLKKAIQNLKLADKPYFFIACDAKPYGLIISKKDITKNAQAKKELSMLAGGSTRPPRVGQATFEGNKLVLEMDKPPTGLARVMQKWIKDATGVRVNVQVGTESADDADDGGAAAAGAGAGAPAGASQAPGAPAGARTAASVSTDDDGNEVVDLAGPPGAPGKGQKGAEKAKEKAGGAVPGAPPAGKAAAPAAAAGAGAGAAPASAAAPSGPFKIGGSVGQGGKNAPADVMAVQTALNGRAKAGLVVDGKMGPKTVAAIKAFQKQMGQFTPDGLVEVGRGTARALSGTGAMPPPPAPPKTEPPPVLGKASLAKAPDVWNNTRNIMQKNVGELKKAVKAHYASEHPNLQKEIDKNLGKLDGVFDKLDTKLADSLAKAQAAPDDASRKAELKNSKTILTNYITYVKSEPLIDHMDKNPFGVQTNIKKTLTASLTHMAQAIGT